MTEKTHEVPAHLQQPHDHHHAQSPMQQVGGGQPHAPLYNGHHGQGVGGVGGVGSFGAGGPGAMNEGAMYQQHLMTQCARGNHSYDTKYGVLGIIVAVCCFPCGLFALCCDKKEVCTRCGHMTM